MAPRARGCLIANKDGHRRSGNIRKLPSGRHQIRYPGPDARIRTGLDTYARVTDARGADKAITDAIDRHVQTERSHNDDDSGATGGPVLTGPLMTEGR
jgi:hypothetical protein